MKVQHIKLSELIKLMEKEARGLLDDPPGTNPEYERGMCELITRVAQHLGQLPQEDTCVTARRVAKEVGASW